MSRKAELLNRVYEDMQADSNTVLADLRASATRLVPGDGDMDAPKLILVGEAPGANEDRTGLPFVGPAGLFLGQLLEIAGVHREDCWVTNVVKFRPPRNRTPDALEVAASMPYLRREIQIVAESGNRSLVALGRTAIDALTAGIGSLVAKRGEWVDLPKGWRLFASYHPSWGLRSERKRDVMMEDFRNLKRTMAL